LWARRGAAAVVAAMAALILPPQAMGLAQPQEPTAHALPHAPGPRGDLRDLRRRAAALEKDYRGDLEILRDAEKAAERATGQAAKASRDLEEARARMRRLAVASYMSGGFDSPPVLFGAAGNGGPAGGAASVEYLARDNTRRIGEFSRLAAGAERARGAARRTMSDARKEAGALERRRAQVRTLLAKYRPETPASRPAAGAPAAGAPATGGPGGAAGPRSTVIGDTMTARMRTALLEIDRRFGAFSAVGCYRAGDPQDHGSGHACDFMESTGGSMPTARAIAHGTSVAQYAITNASRLGVKYVIWRQRIYDLRNPGWRAMEDRGGITANHYDHVHVSVL
jgi:hypothetical protein